MKTNIIILVITIVAFSNSIFSQNSKYESIIIQTSAQCEMCKEKIEKELIFTKGIKNAEIDLTKQTLSVTFNLQKINIEEIKTIISNLGYDAEEVNANKEKYSALPNCCKKPEDRE